MSRVEYEYRGEKVTLVEKEGVIDKGELGWIDDDEEWCCAGKTLEDAKAAFREAVDDNKDN